MIKNNKLKFIIASVITLLPIIFGLLIWDKLPDSLATHWSVSGEADGYSGKAFAVFALPIILLAVFWLCIFVTSKDPKNCNQHKKAFDIIIFLIPFISCVTNAVVYSAALEYEIDIKFFISILLSVMFVLIGNYLPKCKQNYTLGVKIKWTLQNEENWNATHRFTGKVWFVSGLIILFSAFLPVDYFMIILPVLIIPIAVLPFLYSYLYYKKQLKNGSATITEIEYPKFYKKSFIIAVVCIAVLIVVLTLLLFTGDIDYNYSEDSFTIKADYYADLTVDYDSINNIEYRESCDVGMKYNGFNSARLLLGGFENEEFGKYTRYSYTKCEACVVITSNENTLVIGGENISRTKKIYEELLTRVKIK